MKIIDNNGKIFGKVSIVDIVIVLCALLLVASLVYSFFADKNITPTVKTAEVEYSLLLKVYSIYESEREPFSVGDSIYGNDGALIGKVKSLKKTHNVTKAKLQDGSYVDFEHPKFYDYYITVEGKGTENEKGIFASAGLALIPSNNLLVSSKYYDGNAVVLSVEKNA